MALKPRLPVVLVFALLACQPSEQGPAAGGRYLVTEHPLDVGVGPALCVAVDPADEHGAWWWEPGATGCDTRSTGPGVFRAGQAVLSPATPGAPITVSFRLGTHSTSRPFVDVRLMLDNGSFRALDTSARATLVRRPDLDVQERPATAKR